MEVWEAGDGILVRVADEFPPARLEDTADIGQGSLLAEKSFPPQKSARDSKGVKNIFEASWLNGKRSGLYGSGVQAGGVGDGNPAKQP